MENELARMAGPPYRARQVRFKLPDFIDIVLNAGNNRPPLGVAGGQSLPNWGPWADKGGRTMIMSNIGVDADSRGALTTRLTSLLCDATTARVLADPRLETMAIVLHEAAHNLGPTREYKVGRRTDQAFFGGPLATILEELKSETAAAYFPAKLVGRKLITPREGDLVRATVVAAALGSVAQGMYDPAGHTKPYSQLALIELGFLRRGGALEWKADQAAGNGADRGCFELHADRWQAAITPLARKVLRIKSQGDRRGAERLVKEWLDDAEWTRLREVVAERWLRVPRGNFVYAIGGH
jgi:hypothetical protein